MSEPAIKVKNLGKCFRLYSDPVHRVIERLSFGKIKKCESRWIFRGLDFEVPKSTVLGVMGVNGAGKSTLLKILSGTMAATEGSFQINGTLGSLLELGGGFHPGFNGKQNAFMNAAILGIPRSYVRDKIDEIREFSELGRAFYDPIRTYSSGMAMRLAFSIATMRRPDVLILDEVMAVGDEAFQKKCMARIREIREAGTTILFVSHSLYHVRSICDQAFWLDEGKIATFGTPIDVTDAYMAKIHRKRQHEAEDEAILQAQKDGPKLRSISIHQRGEAEECAAFKPGDTLDAHVGWENPTGEGKLHLEVVVRRNDDLMVFSNHSQSSGQAQEGTEGKVILRVPVNVVTGDYHVSVRLRRADDNAIVDHRREWAKFRVQYSGIDTGVYLPSYQWLDPEEATHSPTTSSFPLKP